MNYYVVKKDWAYSQRGKKAGKTWVGQSQEDYDNMLARLNATGKGGSVKLASGGGRSTKFKTAKKTSKGQQRRVRGRKFGYTKSSIVRVVFWLHLRLSCADECLCSLFLQGTPDYR